MVAISWLIDFDWQDSCMWLDYMETWKFKMYVVWALYRSSATFYHGVLNRRMGINKMPLISWCILCRISVVLSEITLWSLALPFPLDMGEVLWLLYCRRILYVRWDFYTYWYCHNSSIATISCFLTLCLTHFENCSRYCWLKHEVQWVSERATFLRASPPESTPLRLQLQHKA